MTCKEFNERYFTVPSEWIAQEKYDGHRAICFPGPQFFSRRISKRTGYFAENTACLPHLDFVCDYVLDGELTHPLGFYSVQSVVGSLAPKALKYQEAHGFLTYNVFDVILPNKTLEERLAILNSIKFPEYYRISPVHPATNYRALLEQFWAEGKEGLILKKLSSEYEEGKRSSNWLKLKEVRTFDVIIMDYMAPERVYTGHHASKWEHWENDTAVTKPHALGWIGAIRVGLLKDGVPTAIADVKGITDEDQIYIKANREALLGTVIEIKAQEVANAETKSLRHPRFNRWRKDKSADACTWETVE
jgi:ATP-dependent DNA ligase